MLVDRSDLWSEQFHEYITVAWCGQIVVLSIILLVRALLSLAYALVHVR